MTGLDMTRGIDSLAIKYLAFVQALAVSQCEYISVFYVFIYT